MDTDIMQCAPNARNAEQPSYVLPTTIIVTDASAIRAIVREEVLAALANAPTSTPVADGLLRKNDAARMLGVSPATIDRAVREGMPYSTIGNGKRFDLQACREWFAARGAKPTTPKTSAKPDADTVGLLEKTGLRLVAGVRR